MSVALFISTLSCIISLTVAQDKLPNFVLLVADDLGWNDVGYHQSTNVYTPTLDLLRESGLELSRFYVQHLCAPSRSALFTGMYPYNIGMQHNIGLPKKTACSIDASFFPQRLESCSNYKGHMIGKWHVGYFDWSDHPLFRGFHSFLGFYENGIDYFTFTGEGVLDFTYNYDLRQPLDTEYATDVWGFEAVQILENKANMNDTDPFLLVVAFNAPHSPFHAVQPYQSSIATMYNFEEEVPERLDFVSMLRAMDNRIEGIVDALQSLEINGESIWSNTWLWFLSDNGPVPPKGSAYPLRGGKDTLFEGGVRVPAFVTGGLLPDALRGEKSEQLIHVTDIAPTLCAQSGADCDDLNLDGVDLSALIEDRRIDGPLRERNIVLNVDNVDCEGQYQGQSVCGGAIKDFGDIGLFKAAIGSRINGFRDKYGWVPLGSQSELSPPTIMCNGETPVFDVDFRENDCAFNNRVCLFNLTSDPCEYSDLSEQEEYQDILEELMEILLNAYESQSDSFSTFCDQSGAVNSAASAAGGRVPWSQQYYGDDSHSLENTILNLEGDECPTTS